MGGSDSIKTCDQCQVQHDSADIYKSEGDSLCEVCKRIRDNDGWIACADRLPENATWVIVEADSEGAGRVVTMAFFERSDHGEIYWLCHNDSKGSEWEGVTDWQPLPKGKPPQ